MLITLTATSLVILTCILMHYEAISLLRRAGAWLHDNQPWHRWHLSILISGLLVVHVLEVLLFGLVYWGLINNLETLNNSPIAGLAQCIYFSFTTYTTLGYGDLTPSGPLRFMAGMEALTGLLLITWTASFVYLQMRQIWGHLK